MPNKKNSRPVGRKRSDRKPAMPGFVTPMAAKVVSSLPEGEHWIYELKFDGYRALLLKDDDRVEIRSRNDRDLTATYPSVASAATRVKTAQAVIDGEIVALDARGRPSFQLLQHRGPNSGHRIVYYAFDLLYLNGADLTGRPLIERRSKLPKLVEGSGLLLSQDLPGTVVAIVEAVRGLGLEGVVAKRKASLYEPGERSGDWQKLKLENQQELVIGGYRPAFSSVEALLVGFYESDGLHFAGKVRAGFVPHMRRELFKALQPLHADRCPFVNLPDVRSSRWGGGVTDDEMHEFQWVKPQLVAQVRFVEWTAENRLRHAKFLGLRPDKNAREVRRE